MTTVTPITIELQTDLLTRLERVTELINSDTDSTEYIPLPAMARVALDFGLEILERETAFLDDSPASGGCSDVHPRATAFVKLT